MTAPNKRIKLARQSVAARRSRDARSLSAVRSTDGRFESGGNNESKRDAKRLDGHRLTEFIYGTVVALVAVAGIDPAHAGWWSGVAVVVIGGVAIWLAHAYSTLMSHRITSGHRISRSDVGEALTSSWPIVSAALLTAVPILGVALSLYAMQAALLLASIVGVIILALVGAVAGIITQETWPRRLVLVLLSSGLGLLVVSIEVAIHH